MAHFQNFSENLLEVLVGLEHYLRLNANIEKNKGYYEFLEEKGYIRVCHSASKEDIYLTRKGRDLYNKLWNAVKEELM